jgi:hypothetical protein
MDNFSKIVSIEDSHRCPKMKKLCFRISTSTAGSLTLDYENIYTGRIDHLRLPSIIDTSFISLIADERRFFINLLEDPNAISVQLMIYYANLTYQLNPNKPAERPRLSSSRSELGSIAATSGINWQMDPSILGSTEPSLGPSFKQPSGLIFRNEFQ